MPQIAARQTPMNFRFAAPGGAATLYEPGSEPVVWWGRYADATRGRPAASLLDRCTATRTCPKVVEVIGSAEFWGLRMSPGLVGTDAAADIPLPDNVRRYYSPGTTHGGGQGGFALEQPAGGRCVLPANPNPMAETNPRADAGPGGLGGRGNAAAPEPLPESRGRDAGGRHACGDRVPDHSRRRLRRRERGARLRLRHGR